MSFAPTSASDHPNEMFAAVPRRPVVRPVAVSFIKDLRELGRSMNSGLRTSLLAGLLAASLLPDIPLSAQLPPAIIVSGESVIATYHAEGAQVYECKYDPGNRLVWQSREPVAALILDGKTVGLHYAGPVWQHIDGSAVRARMVAAAPGATFNDVPWLKLEATEQRGTGVMSRVKNIQRINTKGGAVQGACDFAGAYRSVPFSADYIFLGKGR